MDVAHNLLCVGLIPESEAHSHPLVGFKVHAVRTNEIFLLVADLIAKGLAQLVPLAGTLPLQQLLPPLGVWEVRRLRSSSSSSSRLLLPNTYIHNSETVTEHLYNDLLL